MSGRKRRGDDTAPALFPFLAVLLCTIGALILILVITVTNSHASARRDAEKALTSIEDTSGMVEVVSDELIAQREQLKTKIERRRRDLADVEDHITRLAKSLEELKEKAELIQKESDDTDSTLDDKTDRTETLKKQIDAKRRELLEEIEKQKKRKPAFSIIPYTGANGTSRRPIYLECTNDGVVIQPEGILISIRDLQPPLGPGNPLDAALRLLRTTYQQRDVTFGVTQPPYPLLIVRPDGIRANAFAREAMTGWDDQFGYELVSAEMELKFPPGVPGLKEKLVETVEMAKKRQQALIAASPRGRFPSEMDWDAIDAISTQSGASGGEAGGSGSPVGETNGAGSSNTNGVAKSVESNTGAFTPTGSNAQSSGYSPTDPSPSSRFAPGAQPTQEWKMVQGIANSQVTNTIQRNGSAIQNGQSVTDIGALTINDPSGFKASREQNENGANALVANKPEQANNQNSNNQSPAFDGNLPNTESGFGSSSNGQASNANGTSDSAVASSQGGSGSAASGTRQPNGQAQPSPSGAMSFATGSTSGMPSEMPSAPQDSPNQADQANQVPTTVSANLSPSSSSKAKHVNPDGDLKPISVTAGRGWAASRADGKATPVTRTMNMVVLKDRWLLRSDSNANAFDANIAMTDGPQKAGEELAVAMRKRVDSWGLSLPGGYWSPTLTLEAANDAQQSVARLQKLLEGSGVEIQVVPLTIPSRR